uniref:Uncharacterized protein n=1 Tax=Zea mays TaxID=4577 RepID=B6T231_MAIZE|nr:hypothetical protein [Zea mays]
MDPIGTDSLSRRQVSWPCRAVLCDRLRSHSSNQESRYKNLEWICDSYSPSISPSRTASVKPAIYCNTQLQSYNFFLDNDLCIYTVQYSLA